MIKRLTPPARHLLLVLILGGLAGSPGRTAPMATDDLDYKIKLDAVRQGYDRHTCWMLPMAGIVPRPGKDPLVVMTMQKELLSASDVYFDVNGLVTDDLGKTWTGPVAYAGLGRRQAEHGMTVGITAPGLQWNAARQTLLGIGETSYYTGDKLEREGSDRPAYTTYDPGRGDWTPWATVALPAGDKFGVVNLGCCQRVDLPDGTVLQPAYFKVKGITPYHSAVLRFSFDGRTLTYHGESDELTLPFNPDTLPKTWSFDKRQFIARQKGLFEPSLTRFQGLFYLTMRNVDDDYVAIGRDGLHFGPPQEWRFDDGKVLGSENTQSHWVAHGDRLYLIYTRRGANNENVFRHRAPLFIARVDTGRLCLIRATERILVPNHGAGLGGSVGITPVNEEETWVTTSEVMRDNPDPEKYGANARVFVARIIWNRPNP